MPRTALAILVALSGSATAGEYTFNLPARIADIGSRSESASRIPTGPTIGPVLVVDEHGIGWEPVLDDGGLRFTLRTRVPRPPETAPDGLPDGEVARGHANIRRAWLTLPTERYDHGVLGDEIEAGGLAVEAGDGTRHDFVLPEDSVFEDRRARLVDLDGDGRDEVVVVHSYLDAGAALAVLRLTPEGLEIAAETPPIGRPHRWLNPAAVADFDGDGKVELAYVETPHIGGILGLLAFDGATLTIDHSIRGVSNHVIGSREQDMAAVLDWDGDGVPDLAILDAERTTLLVVSFAGPEIAAPYHVTLPEPVDTPAVATDIDGDGRTDLIFGLRSGLVMVVTPD